MEQNATVKTQYKGVVILLTAALIWGTAFIAQSKGLDNLDAFTFNGIRTMLGALTLFLVILLRHFSGKKKAFGGEDRELRSRTLRYGVILGIVFFFCGNTQQFAFYYTTASKIAFITTTYVFFVPLIGLVFGKRISLLMWLCVLGGVISLYFISIRPDDVFSVNRGDLLTLICAFLFSIHILLIERYSPLVDGIELSCIQFLVGGGLSLVMMVFFESPTWPAIYAARYSILYAGVLSSALAYTLQIVGQQYTEATLASLLLCMESVFAVIAASLILHERLNGREIFGCILMFVSVVAANLVSAKQDGYDR